MIKCILVECIVSLTSFDLGHETTLTWGGMLLRYHPDFIVNRKQSLLQCTDEWHEDVATPPRFGGSWPLMDTHPPVAGEPRFRHSFRSRGKDGKARATEDRGRATEDSDRRPLVFGFRLAFACRMAHRKSHHIRDGG